MVFLALSIIRMVLSLCNFLIYCRIIIVNLIVSVTSYKSEIAAPLVPENGRKEVI